MRIITGKYKGFQLRAPKTMDTRPATDRVKETIFNILANRMSFEQTQVLDLFAGSGSLGFEALSRGAAHVVFVDASENSRSVLKENIEKLRCPDACTIMREDALRFVHMWSKKFDVIFADPPFRYAEYDTLLLNLFASELLDEHGLLVIRYQSNRELIIPDCWQQAAFRKIGDSSVSFLESNTEKVSL